MRPRHCGGRPDRAARRLIPRLIGRFPLLVLSVQVAAYETGIATVSGQLAVTNRERPRISTTNPGAATGVGLDVWSQGGGGGEASRRLLAFPSEP